VMAQAVVSDGEFLDHVPRLEDVQAAAEVDIGGCQVAEARSLSANANQGLCRLNVTTPPAAAYGAIAILP
jgi:hypothetical protein